MNFERNENMHGDLGGPYGFWAIITIDIAVGVPEYFLCYIKAAATFYSEIVSLRISMCRDNRQSIKLDRWPKRVLKIRQ